MQPEDIIQAKEWEQLTDDEKRVVTPLAATEGEYNILKKMLLIALEDAADVPAIGSAVQQQLRAQLPRPSQPKRRLLWWAAAASAIVLIVATLFFLQPRKGTKMAMRPKTDAVPQKRPDTLWKPPPAILPSLNEPAVASLDTVRPAGQKPVAVQDLPVHPPSMAQLNTSVAANEKILVFVTEVY